MPTQKPITRSSSRIRRTDTSRGTLDIELVPEQRASEANTNHAGDVALGGNDEPYRQPMHARKERRR